MKEIYYKSRRFSLQKYNGESDRRNFQQIWQYCAEKYIEG